MSDEATGNQALHARGAANDSAASGGVARLRASIRNDVAHLAQIARWPTPSLLSAGPTTEAWYREVSVAAMATQPRMLAAPRWTSPR